MKQGVTYVEKWLEKNAPVFEQDYKYKVKTVYVCKNKNKDYFLFDVVRNFEGCNFDDIDYAYENNDEKFDYGSVCNLLQLSMVKVNSIGVMGNTNPLFVVKEKENISKQLISLQDATNIIEKTMSGFQMLNISNIEIKYGIINKEKRKETTKRKTLSNGAAILEPYSWIAPGGKNKARPYWSFVMDVPENELKARLEEEKKTDDEAEDQYKLPRRFINVDMQTGEVYYQKDYY